MYVSLSKQDSSKSLVWLNIPEVVSWEKIYLQSKKTLEFIFYLHPAHHKCV